MLLLILPLLCAVSAAAQGRLWRANLADARDFLPGLERNAPDTAWISGPMPGRRLEWTSEARWNGVLRREAAPAASGGTGDTGGVSESEILSARAAQTLWAVPFPGTALGAVWTGALDRNRHRESGELEASVGVERASWGLAWVQSLLPAAAPGRPFLDAAVALPDRRRQAFAWMLAGGAAGRWRVELGMRQEDDEESVSAFNLDSLGNGESMEGSYRTRSRLHRLLVKAPAAGGTWSALAAYATGRPRRPDGEFWFCDSSRHMDGYLAYARPGILAGWEARGRFQEAEAVTLGRRIPPGSEGVKRFHYARNHVVLWELGADAGTGLGVSGHAGHSGADPAWPSGVRTWGWQAGLAYRRLQWDSRPPEEALDTRTETLSYNRLGLSFIANLYGGLYKLSELIEGRLAADLWEAGGSGSFGLGPLRAQAGVSVYRTGFSLRAEGSTLSQRLIVVDTAGSFLRSYRGHLLGVTPRLRAGLDLGAFRLEAEAAQALPLYTEMERTGGAGGAGETGEDPARRPLFRNAFEARARLSAGF